MGEIQYVWADPGSAKQQAALSSVVQAMYEKDAMAIARWVTKDGMDPKMGVLAPVVWDEVDCLLWAQVTVSIVCFTNRSRKCRCPLQMTFVNTHSHRWTT